MCHVKILLNHALIKHSVSLYVNFATSHYNMFKRAGNIAIIFLLLLATGGIPITRHYCGSETMSFTVYSTPEKCCDSHCNKCQNVFKFSKINDVFEARSSVSNQSLIDFVTLQTTFFIKLSDDLLIFSIPSINSQQNIFTYFAGGSPASLGNFRC